MTKKYYTHDGVSQQGPFTLDELNQKEITDKTLIWYLGLDEWVTVDKVPELHHLVKDMTPPTLGVKKGREIQKYKLPTGDETQFKPETKAKTSYTQTIVLSVIGVIIICLLILVLNQDTEKTYQDRLLTLKEIENSDPVRFLEADGEYSENFWGDQIKINGRIKNKASVANYKDVIIRVIFYTKTKTVITTEDYVLYEFFLANGTKEFNLRVPNYDHTETIDWKVIDAKTY